MPFGAEIFYHPISSKDKGRSHQCGTKVLPVLCIGDAWNAGRSWTGGSLIVDAEDLR